MSARTGVAAGLAATVLLLAGCAGTSPGEAASPGSSAAPSAPAAGGSPERSPAASPAPSGTQLAVEVTGGQVSGDTGRVPVGLGEQVTLTVTGDTPDELHLHGYDLTAQLVPGEPAVLTFVADIAGVFEVELHDSGALLLSLQVG
ncbi:hypothetical protein [Trujillonella humicola]|uniref:hypothetical protein n=1 Tax=Trujillonella humicola TaxID=3383699 RepID=UPI003905FC17